MSVGRNDPCPCGSGKKFKKCCIDKPEYKWQPPEPKEPPIPPTHGIPSSSQWTGFGRIAKPRWTVENVRSMSTSAICEKLKALKIPFDEDDFREQANHFECIEEFLAQWKTRDELLELGEDVDFPWLAVYILTERFRPDRPLLNHVGFWIIDGYSKQHVDDKKACDLWWRAWEFVIAWSREHDIRSLEQLDEGLRDYVDSYVSNWLADLDEHLSSLWKRGQTYVRRRLELARMVQLQFPERNPDLLNWGRAEAESLFRLGDPVSGDKAYQSLTEQFPDDVWGYIGWGDEYSPTFAAAPEYVDSAKSLRIYRMGLSHCTMDEDEVIRERIALVENGLEDG